MESAQWRMACGSRVRLNKEKPATHRGTIGGLVRQGNVGVPAIAGHEARNLVRLTSLPGLERSPDIMSSRLTVAGGRKIVQERASHEQAVDRQFQQRREAVVLTLAGTGRGDWPFGDGAASLEPGW